MLGHTGVYWGILGHTGVYWGILGYTGAYWSILGYTGATLHGSVFHVAESDPLPKGGDSAVRWTYFPKTYRSCSGYHWISLDIIGNYVYLIFMSESAPLADWLCTC